MARACSPVAKRDRIARDVVIAGMIDRAAEYRGMGRARGRGDRRMVHGSVREACGARVVTADGAGNGDSPADALMRTILDGAAQYERALIRQRTCAALAAKRARGERAGEVPFGYRLAADGAHLETDASEQAIVERVRALRAGGVSLRSIVADLAAAGCVGRTGKPLALTQVARIAGAAA